MTYYLYKITNNLNGKFYVGVHKTTNPNDDYFGSGKILNRAIDKYGIENFSKEILEYFDNTKEMFSKEKEIVNEEFVSRSDTYNLRIGGSGGFDYVNKITSSKTKSKAGKLGRQVGKERGTLKTKFTKEDCEKGQQVLKELRQNPEWKEDELSRLRKLRKKANTLEAKKKRRDTFKEINHQQGKRNSQYGTMWITNNLSNRKIKKDEQIPPGWKKGRILSLG